MYRERPWTMRQYAGYTSAKETNRRFRYLLKEGQTGLSTAFDLPTQIGYDPDHPLAKGEVGRVGVNIFRTEDVDLLFKEIPLDKVTVSMTINATAAVLLAQLLTVARRRGVPDAALGGTVQNDILKEFIARGTQRFPLAPSLRLAVDVIAFCERHLPRFNPISVSGYHMREAGCTAVQELAFTLADGLAYLEAARARGLDPAAVAARVSFFFGAHNHLFEEAAKFRAARRLWALLLRERFGIRNEKACRMRFHTQTCGATLTWQQRLDNLPRVTVQALAATLGGTQSLHTNAYDEAIGLPSEESVTVALRTQQILLHESGIADVPDPLGGSVYVEGLTDRIEAEARALLLKVEQAGGAAAAVAKGLIQQQIRESAYRDQQALDRGERVVVGVNRYAQNEKRPRPRFRPSASVERVRAKEATAHRRRTGKRALPSLRALGQAARGTADLMPPILASVGAGATVGQISDALEEAFGA
jgi:methylmalonyl-CoA mutase N-terminal domain/subunit